MKKKIVLVTNGLHDDAMIVKELIDLGLKPRKIFLVTSKEFYSQLSDVCYKPRLSDLNINPNILECVDDVNFNQKLDKIYKEKNNIFIMRCSWQNGNIRFDNNICALFGKSKNHVNIFYYNSNLFNNSLNGMVVNELGNTVPLENIIPIRFRNNINSSSVANCDTQLNFDKCDCFMDLVAPKKSVYKKMT